MATRFQPVALVNGASNVWRLHVSGSFMLCDIERGPHLPRGRKTRAIIAYLANHLDERVSRYRLTELLWPERGVSQARGSLRQSLLEIRRAGGATLAQDEASSMVYGMPREAAQLGAAERILPLSDIGPALMGLSGMAWGGAHK